QLSRTWWSPSSALDAVVSVLHLDVDESRLTEPSSHRAQRLRVVIARRQHIEGVEIRPLFQQLPVNPPRAVVGHQEPPVDRRADLRDLPDERADRPHQIYPAVAEWI